MFWDGFDFDSFAYGIGIGIAFTNLVYSITGKIFRDRNHREK